MPAQDQIEVPAAHTVRTIHGVTHVILRGDLDLQSHPQTAAVLGEVGTSGVDDVVLDLHEVDFMDSTGVCALLTLAHTVRSRAGRVRLCHASERDLFLLDVRGGLGLFDLPTRGGQHRPDRAAG